MDNTIYSYHTAQILYDHHIDTCPPRDKFTSHTHDMIEINYLISGNCRFLVEGTIYQRQPDDILILRPAETHMPLMDRHDPYERITVHISPAFLEKYTPNGSQLLEPFMNRDLGSKNQYFDTQFPSGHWKECLLTISANARHSMDEEAYIYANLTAFLSELHLAYRQRKPEPERSPLDNLTFSIIQYINNHLFDSISVSAMSRHFHISETHLNRLFHKATGTSIWKYVTAKRLMEARQKIKSGRPAQLACRECGFEDYSSFFRAYKNRFSVSPRADAPKKA